MLLKATLVGGLVIGGLAAGPGSQGADPEIEATVHALMTGIDEQDGEAITAVFAEGATAFATDPSGTRIVAVPAATFAELHDSGQFGGQARTVTITGLDVTDDLVASVKVMATNMSVHYTYYIGLVHLDAAWKVQTLLQRSRPAG